MPASRRNTGLAPSLLRAGRFVRICATHMDGRREAHGPAWFSVRSSRPVAGCIVRIDARVIEVAEVGDGVNWTIALGDLVTISPIPATL